MTLQQLLYLKTAADLGSFNAAARALHCTQPAVSEQVRRLEQELGVALFTRAGRGLTLTREGRRFLDHAQRVTDAADEALAAVGRGPGRRGRVVTIGTFRNAPYYDIAALAQMLRAADPDARVRLAGQNSAEVAIAVGSGELEAGLVVLPVDDGMLDVRPLFRDEVLLVSAQPARTRAAMSIAALADSPLILYDASHGTQDPTRRQLAARAQAAGVTLQAVIEVEHVETALQLVSRGVGDTIAARAVVGATQFAREVRGVSFEEPLYDHFALITRRRARVSPPACRLIEIVDAWAARVADGLLSR